MSPIAAASSSDREITTPAGRHAAPNPDAVPAWIAGLYDWQRVALEAWDRADRCGVVKAVTGSGKTRLALAAAGLALSEGCDVVVLVPTVELRRQWAEEIKRWLPGARVGGGRDDRFRSGYDVLVAMVQSAARRDLARPGRTALLVADECHRYPAETYALGLDRGYSQRLGLTATYERHDGAHTRFLDAYFGAELRERRSRLRPPVCGSPGAAIGSIPGNIVSLRTDITTPVSGR